jgi:Superinfection immunity protein
MRDTTRNDNTPQQRLTTMANKIFAVIVAIVAAIGVLTLVALISGVSEKGMIAMGDVVLFLIILAVVISIYFLPTIIAASRSHRNTAPIFVINAFLGWTLLGWVLSLAWAFSAQDQKSLNIYASHPNNG